MTMRRLIPALAAVLFVAACSGEKPAPESTPGIRPEAGAEAPRFWIEVYERISTPRITEQDLERSLALLPAEARVAVETPEGRSRLIDELRRRRMITLWAMDNRVFDDPFAHWSVGFAVEEIVASVVFVEEVESGTRIDDDEVLAAYQANPNAFAEWRFSRILAAFDADTDHMGQDQALYRGMELRERIEVGEPFDFVAETESDDPVSAEDGGRMPGWYDSNSPELHPNIVDALNAMQVGELQGPIRTLEGYSIIRLDEARPKPFESVRELIRADMKKKRRSQAEAEFMKMLEQRYPVQTP